MGANAVIYSTTDQPANDAIVHYLQVRFIIGKEWIDFSGYSYAINISLSLFFSLLHYLQSLVNRDIPDVLRQPDLQLLLG